VCLRVQHKDLLAGIVTVMNLLHLYIIIACLILFADDSSSNC
jgi:hypothetical protein